MFRVVAPASTATWRTSSRNSMGVRVASWGLNSTSSVCSRARATAARVAATTSWGAMRSMCSMWLGLVEMNTWTRPWSASRTASQQRSTSASWVRDSPAITGPWTPRAIARTASKSPWLATGKPASMMSTPSRASCSAISSFALAFRLMPGACSPSLSVVSKMTMRSDTASLLWLSAVSFLLLFRCAVGPQRLREAAGTMPPHGGKGAGGSTQRQRSSGSCARSRGVRVAVRLVGPQRLVQVDEGAVVGTDLGDHPVEDAVGDAGVHGQRHQRLAALLAAADLHAGDVHPSLAENGPDPADHAGPGLVAQERHVVGGGHVDGDAVDGDQPLGVVAADGGAGDAHGAARALAGQVDQVHPVLAVAGPGLGQVDAAFGGQQRRVHEGDRLVDDRREHPLEDGQVEDAGVLVGQLARVLDVEPATAAKRAAAAGRPAAGQGRVEAAQLLGQGQERPQRVRDRAGVHVDRVRHELPIEGEQELLGDGDAGLVLRLGGGGPEVRGHHRAAQVEQGALGGWLIGEHVQGGAAEVAGLDRLGQGGLVDDASAG